VTGEPIQNRLGGGIRNLGQVNIGNTILAGNKIILDAAHPLDPSDPRYSPDCYSVIEFRFTSFRGNLVGVLNANCNMQDSIFEGTPFDQVGTPANPLDPGLDDFLTYNGGFTYTYALKSGSNAIDRGTGVTSSTFFDCPATDQRGGTRPTGGACDVGSFESGSRINVTSDTRVTKSGFRHDPASGLFTQTVTVQNITSQPIFGPLALVLDFLGSNATLANKTGDADPGSPFIRLNDSGLISGGRASVDLEFTKSNNAGITYGTRVLAGLGPP
jgi:hypothetical protein